MGKGILSHQWYEVQRERPLYPTTLGVFRSSLAHKPSAVGQSDNVVSGAKSAGRRKNTGRSYSNSILALLPWNDGHCQGK